jgi:hypothetical protein
MLKLRWITGLTRTGKQSQAAQQFRLWNEENRDYEIKRAQTYMLQGFIVSSYVLGVKTIMTVIYN